VASTYPEVLKGCPDVCVESDAAVIFCVSLSSGIIIGVGKSSPALRLVIMNSKRENQSLNVDDRVRMFYWNMVVFYTIVQRGNDAVIYPNCGIAGVLRSLVRPIWQNSLLRTMFPTVTCSGKAKFPEIFTVSPGANLFIFESSPVASWEVIGYTQHYCGINQ
jgi:hypothetical protein